MAARLRIDSAPTGNLENGDPLVGKGAIQDGGVGKESIVENAQRVRNYLGEIGNRIILNPTKRGPQGLNGQAEMTKPKPILKAQLPGAAVKRNPIRTRVIPANTVGAPSVVPRLGGRFLDVKSKVDSNLNRQIIAGSGVSKDVTDLRKYALQNFRPFPHIKLVVPEPQAKQQIQNEEDEAKSDQQNEQGEIYILEDTFSSIRLSDGIVNIDVEAWANPLLGGPYILDITKYLFETEKNPNYFVKARYLDGMQLNSRMRSVLIDWLVEVHNQFRFSQECLFLGIKTLDRYLSIARDTTRTQLQLIGVSCLFIAAKFEEIFPPNVGDMAAVADNSFPVSYIKQAESKILKTLKFDLGSPQPVFFIRRFTKAASHFIENGFEPPFKIYSLAKYIMELNLLNYATLNYKCSEVAAGSLALAIMILDHRPLNDIWNDTMIHYTTYSARHIKPIVLDLIRDLAQAQEDPGKLKSINNKYSSKKFFYVSTMEELKPKNWKSRVYSYFV